MMHPEDCIQCGTCVTVCPVEMVGGHAIVTFLADPSATDYSVWLCTSCWRCHEACPVGVDIYGLLRISQEELGEVRAAWELEQAELPLPGIARVLLDIDE